MIKKNGSAICCNPTLGPVFGKDDFGLGKNLKEGFTYAEKNSNILLENNLELIDEKGSKGKFVCKELEVYKLRF